MIRHLTEHDLSKRYGNLINGNHDVKSHRFFKNIDWSTLDSMKDDAPYIPGASPVRLEGKGLRLSLIAENNEQRNHAVADDANLFKDWF